MEIIPVLDLAGGIAVWAQAGNRARYEPVASALAPSVVGDPVALLRAFRGRLGAIACYIADLDAIQGGAVQRSMIRELAQFETGFAGAIMVDAGAHTPGSTLEVLACGASQVVVGLETLRAFTPGSSGSRAKSRWSSASISAWAARSSTPPCTTPPARSPTR
jgi:phosphoribosylformimino-5-aminoimidazole carboxamide ribotide isomerase